jgi:hypothetical protein
MYALEVTIFRAEAAAFGRGAREGRQALLSVARAIRHKVVKAGTRRLGQGSLVTALREGVSRHGQANRCYLGNAKSLLKA